MGYLNMSEFNTHLKTLKGFYDNVPIDETDQELNSRKKNAYAALEQLETLAKLSIKNAVGEDEKGCSSAQCTVTIQTSTIS